MAKIYLKLETGSGHKVESRMTEMALLALNSGSSSLKFGLFLAEGEEVRPAYRGAVEGIGTATGKLWMRSADGQDVFNHEHLISKQADAIDAIADKLRGLSLPPLVGIGHRVVHGGPFLQEHQRITPQVLEQLDAATHFAPLHMPVALSLIHATQKRFPGVPEFACFDTAFHGTLPEVAARLPLPERFWNAGVRRYGFHGLSCESVLYTLGPDVPPRMIVAHLGNGASLTAIASGLSVDTTMGLTPTGGVAMGTRCGDLDPGVLLHILRTSGSSVDELERLLDKESGLLGISGVSSDMRRLHQATDNPHARLAIDLFARSVKKAIAGFIGILEGLDLLVFTGGIGEHDAVVREKICNGLERLGILLDTSNNGSNFPTISAAESRVRVRIIGTEEEAQIARHTYQMLED
jgi:acetate kinase